MEPQILRLTHRLIIWRQKNEKCHFVYKNYLILGLDTKDINDCLQIIDNKNDLRLDVDAIFLLDYSFKMTFDSKERNLYLSNLAFNYFENEFDKEYINKWLYEKLSHDYGYKLADYNKPQIIYSNFPDVAMEPVVFYAGNIDDPANDFPAINNVFYKDYLILKILAKDTAQCLNMLDIETYKPIGKEIVFKLDETFEFILEDVTEQLILKNNLHKYEYKIDIVEQAANKNVANWIMTNLMAKGYKPIQREIVNPRKKVLKYGVMWVIMITLFMGGYIGAYFRNVQKSFEVDLSAILIIYLCLLVGGFIWLLWRLKKKHLSIIVYKK